MPNTLILGRQLHVIAKLAGKNLFKTLGHIKKPIAEWQFGDLAPQCGIKKMLVMIGPGNIHQNIAGFWHLLFDFKHFIRQFRTACTAN